jgi:hypothetical protein
MELPIPGADIHPVAHRPSDFPKVIWADAVLNQIA